VGALALALIGAMREARAPSRAQEAAMALAAASAVIRQRPLKSLIFLADLPSGS
jgi:hypothetical protein